MSIDIKSNGNESTCVQKFFNQNVSNLYESYAEISKKSTTHSKPVNRGSSIMYDL